MNQEKSLNWLLEAVIFLNEHFRIILKILGMIYPFCQTIPMFGLVNESRKSFNWFQTENIKIKVK